MGVGYTRKPVTPNHLALLHGTPTITFGGSVIARSISVQLRDLFNRNVAGLKLVRAWITDAAGSATLTSKNITTTITTGAALQAITANKHYILLCQDTTGIIGLGIVFPGPPGNIYVNIEVGGKVTESEAILIGMDL